MNTIKKWEDRMQDHYSAGGSVKLYSTERFKNAEIDDLRAALAAIEASKDAPPVQAAGVVEGWISVDDRLPEPGISVLIAMQNGYVNKSSWWSGEFIMPSSEQPTHWMPVPAAPIATKGT